MDHSKAILWGMLVAVVVCALLFSPTEARADSLTGSVGITWLDPDTSTIFATDTIAIGSALSCPGSGTSPVCAGFGGIGFQTFSVGPTSISYVATDWVDKFCCYATGVFNGFDFTGLTFLDGAQLSGFTLTTDMAGLNSSDVTFGRSFIEINLQNIPVNGDFTLNLITSNTVPEPSSSTLLGLSLIGSAALTLKKSL